MEITPVVVGLQQNLVSLKELGECSVGYQE